jgi:hypothetical protein
LDKIIATIVGLKPTVSRLYEKARDFIATGAGKAVVAFLVLGAIVAYAHHRGSESATAKLTPQIEQLKKQLADAEAKPHPQPVIVPADPELAGRLADSEEAKAKLQKKVTDYEKQLARRPAKAGAFILSPADARSLSNIE